MSAEAKMAPSEDLGLELVWHQGRQLRHTKFIIRVSHHVVAMLRGSGLVGSVGAETHKPWGNRQSVSLGHSVMYEKAKKLVFGTSERATTSHRNNEAIPGPANTTARWHRAVASYVQVCPRFLSFVNLFFPAGPASGPCLAKLSRRPSFSTPNLQQRSCFHMHSLPRSILSGGQFAFKGFHLRCMTT